MLFGVIHANRAIWKERGLLNTQETPITYGQEILKLLQAVLKPQEVAVIHCKAHQKGHDRVTQGNRKADLKAKKAALQGQVIRALIPNNKIVIDLPQYLAPVKG